MRRLIVVFVDSASALCFFSLCMVPPTSRAGAGISLREKPPAQKQQQGGLNVYPRLVVRV